MSTGTVKWFNNAKGFGFILPNEGEGDLFAHYSSIEMEGYKTLKAGQTVSFDIESTAKGGHAKNIKVVSSDQITASPISPATKEEELELSEAAEA